MLRVYLLRHAKSSWADPGLADHDRPLAARGRRASDAIADHLREHGLMPELVLCSTATRARETLERLRPALGEPTIRIAGALYGASAGALLAELRAVPDAVESLLMIGHNPDLQELAIALARPGPVADELTGKYPTAGLAVLDFDVEHWRDVAPGQGRLVSFVRPRELE